MENSKSNTLSLKQKIQEFTSESCNVGLINEVVSFYGNGKAVIVRGKLFLSRDDVLASLDEATKQIREKAFTTYANSETVNIDGQEMPITIDRLVSLDVVLAVLGGEKK